MRVTALIRRCWPVPGRTAFARLVAKRLRQAGMKGPFEIDEAGFRILLPAVDGMVNLDGLYGEYQAALPWRRAAVLNRFITGASRSRTGVPGDFAAARGQLLPVIRDAFLYEALDLEMQAEGKGPLRIPTRPLAGRHCIGLVYDWPESMCSIDSDQLATWGVDFAAALEIACENLHGRGGPDLEQMAPGLWCSRWQDSYDAARLLLPSVYRDCSVQGDLVAFTPHRDCLLLTGSQDVEGLARAAAIVEEQITVPRPISALPLVGHHLQWQAFAVPAEHPCAPVLHRQQAMELAGCYGQQQRLLEALQARGGEQGHVAAYTAVQDPDTGQVLSYCVWRRGITTLLPRTDEVVLVEGADGGECAVVARLRWDDLAEFCPGLNEPLTPVLPRYRVQDFPADETRLRERCLALS